MKNSRTTNSIYNVGAGLINNLMTTILSFVVRTVFIKVLGEQCLGLDGLFTNILGFLSLTELGISSAFSFCLYKPISESNNEKISILMTYFRKIYYVIGFVILGIGLCIFPFINIIAKDYYAIYNLYLVFAIYLSSSVLSYFFNYPILLMDCDQKGYMYFKYSIFFSVLMYGLQLMSLFLIPNLYVYLLINVITRTAESIVKNRFVKKYYKNISFNIDKKVSKEDKKELKKVLNGVVFHRIGNYAVDSTDNILISSIVNISTTGLYFNYCSITSILKNIISIVCNSVTSSFGNLNVEADQETKESVFNILNFIAYFLSGLLVVGLFFCVNPFIKICFGSKYALSTVTVAIICFNFYIISIIFPVDSVKTAAGIYYEDRYIPIIQGVINIAFSIVLGIKLGLNGILLGTTICKLTTVNWSKPLTLYKYVFKNGNLASYFKNIFVNCFIICLTILLTLSVKKYFVFESQIMVFLSLGIVSCSIYLIISYLFYHNKKEWLYSKNLVDNKLKKLIKKA